MQGRDKFVSPVITGILSQGVELPGRENDNLSPSNSDIKNEWRYNSAPPISFHFVYRNTFTFTSTFTFISTFTFTSLHRVTSQKTGIFSNTAKNSDLIYLWRIVEASGIRKVDFPVNFPSFFVLSIKVPVFECGCTQTGLCTNENIDRLLVC
jgi:hypothetical protein